MSPSTSFPTLCGLRLLCLYEVTVLIAEPQCHLARYASLMYHSRMVSTGSRWMLAIDIQGHGAPAAQLLQQVALLSPGAASNKTRKNIWFHQCRCVCEEVTQNTQIHAAVYSGSDFHSPRVTLKPRPAP